MEFLTTILISTWLAISGFFGIGDINSSNINVGTALRVLTISQGGTGTNTFTSGECLVGNDGGAITTQACGGLPGAGEIVETMLKAVNEPTDEYVLTYESTTGDFEWEVDQTGAGGSGSMTTVKENGVQLGGADIVTLDFLGADFNLTETPDTEVNISIADKYILNTGDTITGHFTMANASSTGITATNFWGALTGNASTATALAGNGANCGAGQSPLGVDASGAVESCFDVWTESENTSAGYISATLTEEQVEDYVGGMLGGTETHIAVTYQDATNDIDFVVSDDWWNADGDISADAISESKIAFSTACGAGNHYYLNGNDLACEANTTDTNLTQEEVDDFVNLLLKDAQSVNTLITLTYDDVNNAFDFVVDNNLHNYSWANVVDADITDTLTSSSCTGNAATATALATARTIAGVSFDGSANINIASTGLSDTANLLYEAELNTFAELQTQIADEVLLKSGTLTNAKYCIYDSASTDIICNSEGGSGYTNLTSFVDQTAWRVFYSNTAGDVVELALGADGTYLRSNGAAAAPTFTTPSGSGDITQVFDCATGDCNTMTVGTSEYLTYGTGYIDANRFAGVTTVSGTEFGYLNDVTSAIQTQFSNKQPLEATLTDIADGTIAENLVNTANPWADNEVSDTLTCSSCTGNAATCTTASAGDAAVDFFGAGVDAVTDATTCTNIEGTGLSITTGTLNWSASGIAGHDSFSDFVANEHLDWTSDLGATNIHAGNYTDTNTTYLGGTNLTLADTTFNVDDAFMINSGSDIAGGGSGFTWGFNASAGSDPVMTFGDGIINVSTGALQVGGSAVLTSESDPNVDSEAEIEAITGAYFGTSKAVTTGYVWIADGTDFESVVMGGDITIVANGTTTIGADKVHDSMIDWGAGANQVSIADFSGNQISGALSWDFGGATSLEIPNGTAGTVDTMGEIGLDTTDNQFLVADSGGVARVIPLEQRLFSFTIASSTLAFVNGGILPLPPNKDGFSLTKFKCYVKDGTSVVVNMSDGTNDTETITCATTLTSDEDVATNDTFTAGELAEIQIGAITGTPNYLTFTAYGHITRE